MAVVCVREGEGVIGREEKRRKKKKKKGEKTSQIKKKKKESWGDKTDARLVEFQRLDACWSDQACDQQTKHR